VKNLRDSGGIKFQITLTLKLCAGLSDFSTAALHSDLQSPAPQRNPPCPSALPPGVPFIPLGLSGLHTEDRKGAGARARKIEGKKKGCALRTPSREDEDFTGNSRRPGRACLGALHPT
jgi:hypothetical protein